jgi:hypothetical protein
MLTRNNNTRDVHNTDTMTKKTFHSTFVDDGWDEELKISSLTLIKIPCGKVLMNFHVAQIVALGKRASKVRELHGIIRDVDLLLLSLSL